MKTEVRFWDGPITEPGLYLFRYKTGNSYELVTVMQDTEDENSFVLADYPQCKSAEPLEHVSRFEWIKLEDLE